jgi:hypothetical protein
MMIVPVGRARCVFDGTAESTGVDSDSAAVARGEDAVGEDAVGEESIGAAE